MNDEKNDNTYTGLEIAVIGAAGRFPGASNLREFWDNIVNGVDTISFFSDEELTQEGIEPGLIDNPRYIKAKGILEDIQYFDSAFFNYTPAQADVMDPQLRIYHECAWAALEDAGYNPETYSRLIGVYSGAFVNIAWINALEKNSHRLEVPIYDNESSYATRISYSLNLRGPSFTVLSASATSLLAVHLACQGLLNAECDMALAGGVYLAPAKKMGTYSRGESGANPGGHCRAFDAKASGAVIGEGVGIVVLKRLEDAETDRDNIYAVIKGSAVNNDGSGKIGFHVPSMEGQAEAIRIAHEVAEVEPETMTYIEAHGSSSLIADSFEVKALQTAFNSSKKKFCALGSVKTNIGYLNYAAGIAGFIKTILALKHGLIPPSLHYETPNPQIDFNNSPFYVNTRLKPWEPGPYPRRAGVKAFGTGGTNIYVILEEWLPQPGTNTETTTTQQPDYRLVPLSARTPNQLEQMSQNLVQFLKTNPGLNLADAAYTLQVGRKHFRHRQFAAATSITGLISTLSSFIPNNTDTKNKEPRPTMPVNNPPLIFLFPDLSAQSLPGDLQQQLYRKEPLFREAVNQCTHAARPGHNLPAVYHEANIQPVTGNIPLFIFCYALAKLLFNWGIRPKNMLGLGSGEYVVNCLRGNTTLEEALNRLSARMEENRSIPQNPEVFKEIQKEENAVILVFGTNNAINELIREQQLTTPPPTGLVVNFIGTPGQAEQDISNSGYSYLLSQIGRLWCHGVPVDWEAIQAGEKEKRKRISLPAYPFEKEPHWVLETIK